MTNSLGQNPCLITAWLFVPCRGTGNASQVNALPAHEWYIGPGKPSNPDKPQCECNTVVYSLLAACSICQKPNGIQPWPIYSSDCVVSTNGSYPEPIPAGTAVPAWAFLDVMRNSTFDADTAKAVARQKKPDITIEGSSTSSSATKDNTERSSKNVGTIVGGVLGAVISVLLVGALVFCIMLCRRRQTRAGQSLGSSQTTNVGELSGYVTPSHHVPTLKDDAGFYNPDDPRTYPPAPGPGAGIGYTGLPQVMS